MSEENAESYVEELLRLLGGFSSAKLAEVAHVHPSQVSRWRAGETEPSGECAIRLWRFANQEEVNEADEHVQASLEPTKWGKDKPPYQAWSTTALAQDSVLIPADASLLIDWLPSAENGTKDCIGVVNQEGGRRLLPLDGLMQCKIANLTTSLETTPPTAGEFASDRVRLARYLALLWSVTVSRRRDGDFELRVAAPANAIPEDSPVDVFAQRSEILEVFTISEQPTKLQEEARNLAEDFPQMLERFSEL